MDEGWPITDDDGNVIVSRVELIKATQRMWLAGMFVMSIYIGSRGWSIAHHRPTWPLHLVYATIAWLIFAVPVGWVAWSFWRVIRLLTAEDNATQELRTLRKAQELEERQRAERMREWRERKEEHRRRGIKIAAARRERARLTESQARIESELDG